MPTNESAKKLNSHLSQALIEFSIGDHLRALNALRDATAIVLADWSEANGREEITGLTGFGKKRNHGNSGYSGGCTLAVA